MDNSYLSSSMMESCRRCFSQVPGGSTVDLLFSERNGIPNEHMIGLQIYGAKPQMHFYFPLGPVKYHTLFMWRCRACNHQYLTYDFTCGGSEIWLHVFAPRPYATVPVDGPDEQLDMADQRLRAGTDTAATASTADVTATAGQMTPAMQQDHPEPPPKPASGQQGLASRIGRAMVLAVEREETSGRCTQTSPWSPIPVSTHADSDTGAPAISTRQSCAASAAAPKQKARNGDDLREMRKMRACNVCRESNKKCDPSHPGPRMPYKLWKQLKEDEHRTNQLSVSQ